MDTLSKLPAEALLQRCQRLLARVQQLPLPGSRPLTIAGRVAGWITASATRALQDQPGVCVDLEAVHIGRADMSRDQLAHDLAVLALTLRDAGCLRGWRNELLDIVAEGRNVAVIERAAMRPLGLLTRAVHLNAWTPDGRLWVAQRALTKSTDPGLWDTLVGGLSGAGETLDDSLVRESHEEAGLTPQDIADRSPLHTILRMHKRLPEGFQVEDILVSECVLPDGVAPANVDGEVSCIQSLAPDDLWRMICAGAFTIEAELVILYAILRKLGTPLS